MKKKDIVLLWGTMLGIGAGATIVQESAYAQETSELPEVVQTSENTSIEYEEDSKTIVEIDEETKNELEDPEFSKEEIGSDTSTEENESSENPSDSVQEDRKDESIIEGITEPEIQEQDKSQEIEPVKNGWIDQQYYVNGIATTGSQIIDGNEYHFDQNGNKLLGIQTINGINKYFDENTGILLKNATFSFNAVDYYADDFGNLHQLEYVTYTVSKNGTQQVLKGYVITTGSKVDISKINADFIVLNATSGFKGVNSEFKTLADATLKANKLLAMYHDARVGTKEDAHMEAYHFYTVIKDYIGRGLPVLRFMTAENGTGPFWAKEFMDSLYGLTGVRGMVWTSQSNYSNGDWESTEKVYTVTTNIATFYGNRNDWTVKMKVVAPANTSEMYRMYNPNSGEHFYTANRNERDMLVSKGWRYESIGWTAPEKGAPVYRLYNPNAGDHHYTTDIKERDMLVSKGWRAEGIGWYTDPKQTTKVYRSYNPNAIAGAHHFTTSYEEHCNLIRLGWKDEGIAWYGIISTVPANVFPTANYLKNEQAFNKDGKRLEGVQKVGGNFYFFNAANGYKMQKGGGLTKVGTQTIFVNANGVLTIGQIQLSDGWKWFAPETAFMARSTFIDIPSKYNSGKGKLVYYNADGNMVHGSTQIGNLRIVTAGDGEVIRSELLNLDGKYLNQKDPRWGNIYIGNDTIGNSGCVITTSATILNFFKGTNFTPVELGNIAHQNGYYNSGGSGTSSDYWRFFANKNGLIIQNQLNYETAKKALLQGKIIAGAVGYSRWCPWYGVTHEIYLAGYDNGKVKVYDPLNEKNNGWYELSEILGSSSKDPYDMKDGGPFYAIGI